VTRSVVQGPLASFRRMPEAEARDFFNAFFREGHWPNEMVEDRGSWSVTTERHWTGCELSTFDYDQLTRLVLLAHERCVRVHLRPRKRRRIEIVITRRDRISDSLSETHPTIEEAVAHFRKGRGSRQWSKALAEDARRGRRIGGNQCVEYEEVTP
jgi:hypothetical protein